MLYSQLAGLGTMFEEAIVKAERNRERHSENAIRRWLSSGCDPSPCAQDTQTLYHMSLSEHSSGFLPPRMSRHTGVSERPCIALCTAECLINHGIQSVLRLKVSITRSVAMTAIQRTPVVVRFWMLIIDQRCHTGFLIIKKFRNDQYGLGTVLARFWHCARD